MNDPEKYKSIHARTKELDELQNTNTMNILPTPLKDSILSPVLLSCILCASFTNAQPTAHVKSEILLENDVASFQPRYFTTRSVNGTNYIMWSVQTEVSELFFVLERSENGIDYTPIHTDYAPANPNKINLLFSYQEIIEEKSSTVSYRILKIDIHGTASLSEAKSPTEQVQCKGRLAQKE